MKLFNRILTLLSIAILTGCLMAKLDNDVNEQIHIKTAKLNSTHALLVERASGEALMQKNSAERMYPASMTKIMTVLVALEAIEDLNTLIQIPAEIFPNLYAQNAAMAGFHPDQWVPAIELMHGIMLPSGADSTLATAIYVAGSEESFVQLMNQKAAEIGLSNTNFTNPVGLHHPDHYPTAEDMVELLQYALGNPTFKDIFTTAIYTTESDLALESTMFKFLPRTTVDNGEIIGGRTGFTYEAGRCLISLANINGKEYILVTMGAKSTEDNTIRHLEDAIYIYDQL